MPTLITNLSPAELFNRAVTNARKASAAIDELIESALTEGETVRDRFATIARHALVLSQAFTIVDTLMAADLPVFAPCDCGNCKPVEQATPSLNTN